MSTQYIKVGMYIAGAFVFSGVLLFLLPPSSDANSEFQQQLQQNQGMLKKDMIDSRRNTQQLMAKLQQASGDNTTKK